jgi:hypothetical protein
MKSLKNKSRLLVESILSDKLLDANTILEDILQEAEEIRENEISDSLGNDVDDSMNVDTEGGEADDVEDVEGGESIDEPTDGDPTLGDNLNDDLGDESDDENAVGNGELSEMSNDIVEINCEINQKIIGKLYDKISNLKSQLNSLDLDKDEREYISLETKLAYYGNKLEELQSKTNPAIDQSKVEERITIIDKALKTLESEISGSDADAMGEEIKTTEELDEPSGEEPSTDLSGEEETIDDVETDTEVDTETDTETDDGSEESEENMEENI